MFYYLEEVNGIWEARDHWNRLITSNADKALVRDKAESLDYKRFC
jgi:hypothetical protein